MFLFLTSSSDKTLSLLVPYLPTEPQNLKVAFIPTAADLYEEKHWIDDDRVELARLGFQVSDLDIKNKSKEEIQKALSEVDIIFVAGGNTYYLLEQAQLSGFYEVAQELVRNGKIYIGSSAGSLLAGPDIEYDKIYDDGEFGKTLDSYKGLGFVDFVIVPHADKEIYKPYVDRAIKEYGHKVNLRMLNDNQALLIRDREIIELEA